MTKSFPNFSAAKGLEPASSNSSQVTLKRIFVLITEMMCNLKLSKSNK